MNKFTIPTAILFTFLLYGNFVFGQAKIEVSPKDATTVTLSASGFDIIEPIAGSRDPYYSFLWIFGDGTFLLNTRDSVVDHSFGRVPGTTLSYRNVVEARVYPTNNYGGGTRPPTGAENIAPNPDPTEFLFRPPSILRQFMSEDSLNVDETPTPDDASVIDTTKTNFMRLQLNHEVRPEGTLMNILSFRNLYKQEIPRGQLYLFYNSKIKEKTVTKRVAGEFRNGESTPEPTNQYSKFTPTNQLVHYSKVNDNALFGEVTGTGVNEFQNFLVLNYDSLLPEGRDERHIFLEFENDTSLWNLIDETVENSGDSVKFLAVMTALTTNDDLIALLPDFESDYLDSIGVRPLLNNSFYGYNPDLDSLVFFQTGSNFNIYSKVVGASEIPSAVKKSHDPNKLEIYACECPESGLQKLVCRVTCTNEGEVPTSAVKIKMTLPAQLDIRSIQNISHFPSHSPSGNFPIIDTISREVDWNWFAALQSAQRFGQDHPLVQGEVIFSVFLKEGFDINDIEPMNACIQFDINPYECTPEVSPEAIITTIKNKDIIENLECKTCEYTPTTPFDWCFGMPFWLCILVYLLIFLIGLWIAKMMYQSSSN